MYVLEIKEADFLLYFSDAEQLVIKIKIYYD